MHKQLSMQQQTGDAGAEPEAVLGMRMTQPTEMEHDYVVTFDVGGTIIRTYARTLLDRGCNKELARAFQEQRDKGLDADPIFVDCDPADFMLMLNFFRYGSAYIDADTLARVGHIRAHIGMTSAGHASSCSAQGATAPSSPPRIDPEPRLCDDEYARVHSEMQQLLSFILCVDHDKAQRAVERYARLDAMVYHRSADGIWHFTDGDVSHARAEMDRLGDFILNATIRDEPVDAETRAWAQGRYRHLDALLAQVPSVTAQARAHTAAHRTGGFALTTGQKNALFVGVLFLVPVFISALAGSHRATTTYYR